MDKKHKNRANKILNRWFQK